MEGLLVSSLNKCVLPVASALSTSVVSGYYQPAGPLIQHPSTLPPIKGPPPDTTPTPPQNSEGSDDLVTPLSTSGGNSSAGNKALIFLFLPFNHIIITSIFYCSAFSFFLLIH